MSPFLFRHASAQPNQSLSSSSVSAAALCRGMLNGRLTVGCPLRGVLIRPIVSSRRAELK